MYDVIIVGAGPAGLTAALYASRRQLKTLVISKDLGGQAVLTDKIYNYPGVVQTAGMPLMKTFKQQAEEVGTEFLFEQVNSVTQVDGNFEIVTDNKKLQAKSVILAFGLTPRDLEVPGEKEFKGKTIFCAPTEYADVCKGKDVAVIGGGNSAFDAVVYLADIANKVYLVHRRDAFRGEEITLKKIKELSNVEFVLNSTVEEVKGSNGVESIVIKDVTDESIKEITVQAVSVNIGYSANTKWLEDLIERDVRGHILISRDCETKTPGLFAAGDCTDVPYKQIITSGGEGCKAAMTVYKYLMEKEGKRAVMIDWT